MSTTEHVPSHAVIEYTEHALARAAERLHLSEGEVRRQAPYAKRVDLYKDGLRLWRIEKGWLAVHEHALSGGEHFRAVVITALADDMLPGWAPRSPGAYTPSKRSKGGGRRRSGPHRVAA